jgi:hypothetical protein
MIATGKVAEYVTEFEEFKAEMKKRFPEERAKIKPLTEDDQINLFKITSCFEFDEVFKNYIMGCFHIYGKARIKSKETLLALLEMLSILDSALNK